MVVVQNYIKNDRVQTDDLSMSLSSVPT